MSENKEEIRYILKFYYKKGRMRLRLLQKFVMFMMQYQYVWHKAGSNVFNLEILMSMMHFALVDQSRKVDEIMEKVERKRHISIHNIDKKLNIDHNHRFKSFGKS